MNCSCTVSVLYSLYENAAPPHKEDFFMGTTSKSEYTQLCTEILEAVGGSKNVKNVFHCITRLRIVPVNRDAVDMEKLSKVSGILKVVESSGQIQCVIGTTVPEAYEEFLAVSGVAAGGTVEAEPATDDVPEKKPNIITRGLNTLASCVTPGLYAIVAGGDVILALPSTGVHSNGFSLVRKVFNIDADPDVLFSTPAELGGKTLGEALLAPTKIYVKPVLKVLEEVQVKGISHITGGGFYENIPRSLKKGCCARINKADVRTPALFHLMQKVGGISEHDMFNTFNMGVGMVLTVPAEQADKALEILHANGEPEAYRLGVIAEGEGVELC